MRLMFSLVSCPTSELTVTKHEVFGQPPPHWTWRRNSARAGAIVAVSGKRARHRRTANQRPWCRLLSLKVLLVSTRCPVGLDTGRFVPRQKSGDDALSCDLRS